MRKILFPILLISLFVNAQPKSEIQLKSEVKEVTLFTEGCQILRTKLIELPLGESTLRFTNLSPYLDAKSVQLKTDNQTTILSVNHQVNKVVVSEKSTQAQAIIQKIEALQEKQQLENAQINTLDQEIEFLTLNRKIVGDQKGVTTLQLKEALLFFNEKYNENSLKRISISKNTDKIKKEIQKLNLELNTLNNNKEYPTGEVIVKVETKQAGKHNFELSYLSANAGWMPNYDIVAKSIEDPIQLIYKATVYQNTREEWSSVSLKLSSSNPNRSGVAPKLAPYYVKDGYVPFKFKSKTANSSRLAGTVVDANTNEPLIGATILLIDTSIGSVTDVNGNFSFTLPHRTNLRIKASYIGYNSAEYPVSPGMGDLRISLSEDNRMLEEVVVMGYGSAINIQNEDVKIQKSKSVAPSISTIEVTNVQNTTTFNFTIKKPYTVPSDGKPYTVSIDEYSLPATYQYYAVPKIDKEAFLTAKITDWEKYNLMDGEANIFFEQTYLGKTVIDLSNVMDTLTLSLGRDKGITINRELQKTNSTKQFIGSKKEDTRSWKTTIRNNKNSKVNLFVVDQVPISQSSDIEIKHQLSESKPNPETGEVNWTFELAPSQTKELNLQYSIKYPKNSRLFIE